MAGLRDGHLRLCLSDALVKSSCYEQAGVYVE